MGKFSTKGASRTTRKPDALNVTGAPAYAQSDKMKFASILLTSFVQDQFYRTSSGTVQELTDLLGKIDPLFAAKAAIFARDEFNMRSITHVVGAEVPARVKGERWTKNFIDKVIVRPDDATEILAYYLANFGKPVPNSLKKGLALGISKFDAYQLAKYRGEGNAVSLVDVVNLVHVKPNQKNRDALAALVEGTLRSEGTRESVMSKAGSDAGAKTEAWADLIHSNKIGYMALLKNLRNIEEQAPEHLEAALQILTSPQRIAKSRVLPFRFATAIEHVSDTRTIRALNKAVDIACGNVPKLSGKTLIAVDHSGSMGGFGYSREATVDSKTPQGIGDLFAAVMFKSQDGNADVMVFGSTAGYVTGLNPDDSILTIMKQIAHANFGHATNFPDVLKKANKSYERVITLSDMQSYIGEASAERQTYERKHGKIQYYNFDLAGHGTTIFKERTYELVGFSEKVFDIMAVLERDPNALVNAIEAVVL